MASDLTFKAPSLDSIKDFHTRFLPKTVPQVWPGPIDAKNEYEVSTWLYADTAFDTWKDTVEKSGTENQKELALQYSSYTLRMYCNIKKIDGKDYQQNRTNSGCCLRDASQKGGGYCMLLSGKRSVNSLFLTDANFATVLASPYDLTAISAPQV